jgi:hypothetical protein
MTLIYIGKCVGENGINVHARTDCASCQLHAASQEDSPSWVVIGVARADQGYTSPERRVAVATNIELASCHPSEA